MSPSLPFPIHKMKKLVIFLLAGFGWGLLVRPVLAQNKVGINIGDRFNEFNQAAEAVKPGGWVVLMACPGDGKKIEELIRTHPEINIIIRGHYPGQKLDRDWALAWTATLGNLKTPHKIYFMPWNEPNQEGSTDYGSPEAVKSYINLLSNFLDEAGLRNRKVMLLSPMMNQSHPNFSSYVNALGKGDFFSQFDGIALSLYDFGQEDCDRPLCSPNPHRNPSKFKQILTEMGVSDKSVFGVESGTAGQNFYWKTAPASTSPLYRFTKAMEGVGVKMFALPAYDLAGEAGHQWNLFSPPDTIDLLKKLAQPSNPAAASTGWSQNFLQSYNLVTCSNGVTAGVDKSYCSGCSGGGSSKPITGPVVINPQNLLVCNDFDLDWRRQGQTTSLLTPSPAVQAASSSEGLKTLTGQLRVERADFPNLSAMENNLFSPCKEFCLISLKSRWY